MFTEAASGAAEGVVFPASARPMIYAISEADDTSTAFADTLSGEFMFRGLPAGNYNLEFMPLSPFSDTTLKNILIETGKVTSIDTLKFK